VRLRPPVLEAHFLVFGDVILPYRVTFVLSMFDGSDKNQGIARRAIGHLLTGLTAIDVAYLRNHPEAPLLRQSGVQIVDRTDHPLTVLTQSPTHQEDWRDVGTCLRLGAGHWEDLACWRAAEQIVRSRIPAQPPTKAVETARVFPHTPELRVTFVLSMFGPAGDREVADEALGCMLRALTSVDADYLHAHPEVPLLYQSGVRYQEEPPGQEDWQDVAACTRLGNGDCEDLACWRAAELVVRCHVGAAPTFISRDRANGGRLFHIQDKYPDGRVEDPSRRLGMR